MSFSRGNRRCFLNLFFLFYGVDSKDVEAEQTCAFTRSLSLILTSVKTTCSAQPEMTPVLHQVSDCGGCFHFVGSTLKRLQSCHPPLSHHLSPCQIRTPKPVLPFCSTLLLIPSHILPCEAISPLRPAPFPCGSCE